MTENPSIQKPDAIPAGDDKYTRDQLDKAFKEVANKENWKYPVDAEISEQDRDITERAIIYFTGSVPLFTKKKNGRLRVRAVGYYVAIGS
jgi:hypothetical protein